MKNKYEFVYLLSLVLILIISTNSSAFAKNKVDVTRDKDYFNKIIEVTDAKISESGVQVSFENIDIEHGNEKCNEIFEALKKNIKESLKSTVRVTSGVYSIEFSGKTVNGYVENIKSNKDNNIIINLRELSENNEIKDLNNKIDSSVKYGKDIRRYEYLKAEVKGNGVSREMKNRIITLFQERGAKDIEGIEINNGFSIIANTGMYQSIKTCGKITDINCAVCDYGTKSEIVIGSPIINETY